MIIDRLATCKANRSLMQCITELVTSGHHQCFHSYELIWKSAKCFYSILKSVNNFTAVCILMLSEKQLMCWFSSTKPDSFHIANSDSSGDAASDQFFFFFSCFQLQRFNCFLCTWRSGSRRISPTAKSQTSGQRWQLKTKSSSTTCKQKLNHGIFPLIVC